MAAASVALLLVYCCLAAAAGKSAPKWRDVSLPADVRAADLLPRLTGTVKDKHGVPMTQRSCVLDQQCPSFELADGSGEVPEVYNVECLHGPATAYNSTIFPSSISQAATFNPALSKEIAKAIADTLRAAYNAHYIDKRHGVDRSFPYCFAPDVNLVRDPRYGRGQETWGECPYLVSQFGKSFTTGLQTLSPPPPPASSLSSPVVPLRQPEVAATCKHLIAYDHTQGYADAKVDVKNLVESYLMGFEGCAGSVAKNGGAAMSTMCSYGLVNGVPVSKCSSCVSGLAHALPQCKVPGQEI
jgi:beta-glucosidase